MQCLDSDQVKELSSERITHSLSVTCQPKREVENRATSSDTVIFCMVAEQDFILARDCGRTPQADIISNACFKADPPFCPVTPLPSTENPRPKASNATGKPGLTSLTRKTRESLTNPVG